MNTALKIFSVMLFTAGVGIAGVAHGAEPARRVVSYADLNLDTIAGVEALYGRISAAASAVCGRDSEMNLSARAERLRCVGDAIENAIVRVENYNLTAHHLAKTHGGQTPEVAARR